jgi:PAS domain S-box-containing protein
VFDKIKLRTISGRAIALILPAAILLFSALTWIAYEGARQRAISSTTALLEEDRALSQQELSLRFKELADAQQKASELMAAALSSPTSDTARFERLFPKLGDGTRRSADRLWTGDATGISPRGYGAFIANETVTPNRRATLLAAFDTLSVMAEGLPEKVDNLYFFSTNNDLIMFAPKRSDNLVFYRKDAPADLAFQDEEFSVITMPKNNPTGEMRCTSLQPILYDEEHKTWTTGCMIPVQVDGKHLGAWGSSVPLDTIFPETDDQPQKLEILQIVITDGGQLIKHPKYTVQSSTKTGDFLDLDKSDEASLTAMWGLLKDSQVNTRSGYLESSDQYYSFVQMDRPGWFVISAIAGDKVRAQAFEAARSVLFAGAVATAAFALFLIVFLRRQLALPLKRLAERADSISSYASSDGERKPMNDGEIARLDRAFDSMESRVSRERLRMSQSFDTMVDAIDDYAILLLDQNGAIRRANRAAKEHFHWDERSETGLRQIFDPVEDSSQMLKLLLAKVEEEGRVFQAPRRYRGNGKTFWATEIIQVIQNEDGQTDGFAYIVRDSSEEYRRVAKMEENLRLLNMAEDTGMLGHFTYDLDYEELTISRWIGEQFNLPTNKPIKLGRILNQLEPNQESNTAAEILGAIEDRREFDVVANFKSEQGLRSFIQIKGEPIASTTVDGLAEVIGFFGIAREITQEKQEEAKLVAARDLAQSAAEMRMNLLASVSHEIRTPMSGILGMLDQMRRGGSVREKERALDLIESSSQALMRILDDVLQQAKLESGKVILENRAFEPAALIRQTAELFIPLAKRNSGRIETTASCRRLVMGDPTRIQQVLANFTSNAVKFVGNGTVRIECEDQGTSESGQVNLLFTVSDNGIGIEPVKLERLFEKFEQAEATTELNYGGTGLGLSICRDLAHAMGGEVGASSHPGEGSSFWLRLTLDVGNADLSSRPGLGKNALVIEPAAMARIAAEIALDELGFEVHSVGSIDEARLAEAKIDLVLYSDAIPTAEELKDQFPLAQMIASSSVVTDDKDQPTGKLSVELLAKFLNGLADD